MTTLPEFLHGRVAAFTELVMLRDSRRDDWNSPWHYFTASEGLKWNFRDEHTLIYTRRNHAGAQIILSNLQPGDVSDADIGKPVILSKDLIDRYTDNILISDGASLDTEFSHTFSKTTTLKEAAEVALKLAYEMSLGYKSGSATGGIEGGVKFTAEASAKYSREWGSSETTTNTVKRGVHITGPWAGLSIAERSVTRQSITMTVDPNFQYSISIVENGKQLYGWDSFGQLMQVLNGNAPNSYDLAESFRTNPLSQGQKHWPVNRRAPKLEWTAVYDNVNSQDIQIVKDGAATQRLIEKGTAAAKAVLDEKEAENAEQPENGQY